MAPARTLVGATILAVVCATGFVRLDGFRSGMAASSVVNETPVFSNDRADLNGRDAGDQVYVHVALAPRALTGKMSADEDNAPDVADAGQLVPAIYARDPDIRFVYFRHVSKWM